MSTIDANDIDLKQRSNQLIDEYQKRRRREACARYRKKNASVINAKKRNKRAENIEADRKNTAERVRNYRERIKETDMQSEVGGDTDGGCNDISDNIRDLPLELKKHIEDFAGCLDTTKTKSQHAASERKKLSSKINEQKRIRRAQNIDLYREQTAERVRNHRKRRRDETAECCDDNTECATGINPQRLDDTTLNVHQDFSYFTDCGSEESTPPIDLSTPVTFLSDMVNEEELEQLMTIMSKKLGEEEDVDENGDECFRSKVCLICDRIIIGQEKVEYIDKDTLIEYANKLCTGTYQDHFGMDSLNPTLEAQYRIDDWDLQDLLLSPRAKYSSTHGGYQCCVSCYTSLRSNVASCPKYSIANGFAIGHIPETLKFKNKNNDQVTVPFDSEKELTDLLCAAISPVRPFGYIHAYSGGCQKQIKGHFSLFSVDQSHVGGVINKFRDEGGSKNIYVVLCGRMTPAQKSIVKRKAVLDTAQFLNLLTWFIKSSGHKGYEDVVPPDECPDPIAYIEDEETENNTDTSENPQVENQMGQNTYYFSSGSQNPQPNMSVYNKSEDFIHEMLDNVGDPTMLMYGGSYLKSHEIKLEDAFPIQFPFGTGGPNMGVDRRVKVSTESCLKHYMSLSLNQFMRADFIMVCYQMLCRSRSFTTGLIKCRSDLKGTSLAEKLSNLTIEDMKQASTRLSSLQDNNEFVSPRTEAESFLNSVTSSCKSIGHTAEAAKDARKKVYAMGDRFGPHSIFFTVTPDDQCITVKMYANQGKNTYVPGVDCSEADCIADFNVRVKTRLKYPGACSLYYQSALQKVYEMLGWDVKTNKAKRSGIFGRVEAFCRADEEQGRGTLHGHFLIWIKNFNKVLNELFSEDASMREHAREMLRNYIDKVFCADYNFDQSLPVVHEACEECESDCIDNLFEERDLQTHRDARSKSMSAGICGKVAQCCGSVIDTEDGESAFVSTNEISNCYLRAKSRDHSPDDNGVQQEPLPADIDSFLTEERRDLLTARYPHDLRKCDENEGFLFDKDVRHHIATKRMNEHDWRHRPSCFKYGGECRYWFPFTCQESTIIKVDELDNSLGTVWRSVNGTRRTVYPFSPKPKRGMGSQYLNTHSPYVTRQLGCNSNIQIGSPRCVFYVVHYTTKNTQKEDRGPDYERIGHQVMARIQREKDKRDLEVQQAEADGVDLTHERTEEDLRKECFREGLCRFLIGMSIHLSQDVVSATMSHLLVCQKGTRFTFSHEFKDLLLGQMLNCLSGKDPGDFVLRRRMKNETEADMWPDFSVNDYLYRHECLEAVSFYDFTSRFEKLILSSERMMKLDPDGLPKLHKNELRFKVGHPGRRYCILRKTSQEKIPKVSMPHGMACNLEELELFLEDRDNPDSVSDTALYKRENYAKVALLLFTPFRDSDIFSLDNDDCLWDKFQRLMNRGDGAQFFHNGQFILQNMQDSIQGRKCKLPVDEVKEGTKLTNSEDACNEEYYDSDFDEYDDAESVATYDEGEQGEDMTFEDDCTNRKLDDLKHDDDVQNSHLISSRNINGQSLFPELNADDNLADSSDHLNNEHSANHRKGYEQCDTEDEYRTILAFVSGVVVSNADSAEPSGYEDGGDMSYLNEFQYENLFTDQEWSTLNAAENIDRSRIPTMRGVCQQVASEKGIVLDRIQYVAYEIICSTFLLDVMKQCWEDQNFEASGFATRDGPSLDDSTQEARDRIIGRLKDMGAKDQLIMYMTGPAGAGKSTAIEVAQLFCFEFCRSLGLMWNSNTFLFTALSGCAAALFGGVTLHSAAFLNSKFKNVPIDMIKVWRDVKMLIVDEISFGTVKNMEKLNDHLNMIRKHLLGETNKPLDPTMEFGGYSIIFSGDFHQIPPVNVRQKNLLWKNPGLWDTAINVAIVLDNSHRFNDDPEYGCILKRMWNGTFSKEDCDKVNQRLIGRSVSLPETHADSDISYACWTNKERSTVHASLFQNHIKDFPNINSDMDPPEHTVILEAAIGKASGRRPKATGKSQSSQNIPKRINVSRHLKKQIYAYLGDCDVKDQNKGVDPALKLYVGCNCMVNDNANIKSGLANGTLCRVVSIKPKQNASKQIRNYDGKKVYALEIADLEYVEFEHFPKKKTELDLENKANALEQAINQFPKDSEEYLSGLQKLTELRANVAELAQKRRFRLNPKRYYCTFDANKLGSTPDMGARGLRKSKKAIKQKPVWKKITVDQLPININDATTAHKLQGASKQSIIVHNWVYSHGWVYTVLSRVRTRKGLFLSKKLQYKNNGAYYQLPTELLRFEARMRSKIPEKARK